MINNWKNLVKCFFYLLFTITGTTLIKFGGTGRRLFFSLFGIKVSIYSILGTALYGCSFLLFVFVISKMKISIMIPVLAGLNCILLVLVGHFLFKEGMSLGQLVGIVVIIAGTVMVGCFGGK